MSRNSGSFLTWMRQRFFDWRINREIFERLLPHLRKEKSGGYPFRTREEMKMQIESLDSQLLLQSIEEKIRAMPNAYGESFSHIMHRDMNRRLRLYENLAQRRVQPNECDPRFVARKLVPVQ